MAIPELIEDLILRFLLGETDEEENERVGKLLAEDKEIAAEYRCLLKVWQYGKYSGKWGRVDMENSWQRIKAKHGRKRVRLMRLVAVAASFVVLGGIAIALLNGPGDRDLTARQVAEVVPGKAQAQLKLASGETVDLAGTAVGRIYDYGTVIDKDTALLKYEKRQKEDTAALAYNELIIPRGGEYSLLLSDGTKVWLNADSRLKYPVAFARDKRKVWLEGEAYFEVAADSSSPFMVETALVGVKVLGTGFNVMAYRNEDRTEVTLVHGKVDVETVQGNALLKPREQLVFQHDGGQQEVREVNVNTYISWKEGVLAFDAMPLSELADRLGRWYNIDFFFTAEDVKLLKFSGAFKRYDDIQYVLTLISETTDVQFVLKNRTVTVYRK